VPEEIRVRGFLDISVHDYTGITPTFGRRWPPFAERSIFAGYLRCLISRHTLSRQLSPPRWAMDALPGVATWTTSAGFLRGVNNGVDGMTDFQADELALLMTGDRQYLLEPGHRMPALTTTGRTAPCRKATTGR
tara:strand:+ start:125 stop:526 length:402 start_codon:yes stop_codon:yes gene_type:complete